MSSHPDPGGFGQRRRGVAGLSPLGLGLAVCCSEPEPVLGLALTCPDPCGFHGRQAGLYCDSTGFGCAAGRGLEKGTRLCRTPQGTEPHNCMGCRGAGARLLGQEPCTQVQTPVPASRTPRARATRSEAPVLVLVTGGKA